MATQNRYQTVKELGRNPEGGRVTSLGLDTSVNPPVKVVLKEFRFAQQDSNWSGFKAYQQEIEVLKALNHPRIPGYRDSFETAAGFCLVQEYKEASSLDKRRTFKAQEIKQIAVSLLEILVYLQSHVPPVIHRDIKPENILIDKQKNVYLVDFGFARIGREKNAVSSVCAGTMGFMSPEQLFNRPLSEASDVYSLGATLIALVTNTRSANIGNLVDDNSRFNLQGIAPQLNPLFMKWLKKMVEPNSKRRFPNAEAALKALQPIDITGKSSPLTILRDLCKNLNLSPKVRLKIIACGCGSLIISAFFLPNSLKYPIFLLFQGRTIREMCQAVIYRGESTSVMNYLKWGGNPNATIEYLHSNMSLLECALIPNDTNKNLVKQLIDKGADVNVVTKSMRTPLLLIAYKDNRNTDTLELASLLIAKGAQVNVDVIQESPLSVAISKNNTELAKLLIAQGARVNLNTYGGNLLHVMAASERGNRELVEILIAKGVDINAKNFEFDTPLSVAFARGNTEMTKILIFKGAAVNLNNSLKYTPLHMTNNPELIKILLAKGADINAKDFKGETPLSKAVISPNGLESAKILLAKGADVNAKNLTGNTPLHQAVSMANNIEMVQLLLAKFANTNIKNSEGDTPLHTALNMRNDPELTNILLAKGADVNAQNNQDNTPLHQAVNRTSDTEMLLAKGADVNVQNKDGNTPLHNAVQGGYSQTVKLLVAKGADVNAKNNNAKTPLDLARINQKLHIIKILQGHNSSQ